MSKISSIFYTFNRKQCKKERTKFKGDRSLSWPLVELGLEYFCLSVPLPPCFMLVPSFVLFGLQVDDSLPIVPEHLCPLPVPHLGSPLPRGGERKSKGLISDQVGPAEAQSPETWGDGVRYTRASDGLGLYGCSLQRRGWQ